MRNGRPVSGSQPAAMRSCIIATTSLMLFSGPAIFMFIVMSSVRWRLVSTGLRPQERRQIDVERTPHAARPRHPAPAVVHELERARRSAHAAIAPRGLDVEHVHEIAVVLDEIRRDRADRAEIALVMR